MSQARCMKCKEQKEVLNEKIETTKNGKKMLKGTCKECGTKVCKFLPNK